MKNILESEQNNEEDYKDFNSLKVTIIDPLDEYNRKIFHDSILEMKSKEFV